MRLAAFLCAAFFSSLVHAQAVAPTAPQRPTKPMIDVAERHFHDGVKFTEEGNYEAARVCFESGYKLSGEPDFLHNLSWTAERQGHLSDAISYAERYLEARPNADNAERTRRRIELLRSRLGPLPQPEAPKPAAQPDPAPNATSAPPSPPPPQKARKVPPGAIGLLAGGGALALAGVGLLAGASATGQQAQAQGLTFEEWNALGDKGRALSAGGLSLAIVGGVAVVGGGIWAIVGRKSRIEQPEIAE